MPPPRNGVVAGLVLGLLAITFVVVSLETGVFEQQYRLYHGKRFRDALRPQLRADARFSHVEAGCSTSGQVFVVGHVDCEADALALIRLVYGDRRTADVSFTIVLPDGCASFYQLLQRSRPTP